MSNIKFTEEERKTVWDIVTEYTNLNSSAATLKTEILSNKETVAELIDKLQNGKIAEGEDPVILNERLGNIMQNHQDHSLALNNIIEELGIVKANEELLYKQLASKYDVEVNTIISEVTNFILS
jgi:hypothetical protein